MLESSLILTSCTFDRETLNHLDLASISAGDNGFLCKSHNAVRLTSLRESAETHSPRLNWGFQIFSSYRLNKLAASKNRIERVQLMWQSELYNFRLTDSNVNLFVPGSDTWWRDVTHVELAHRVVIRAKQKQTRQTSRCRRLTWV